MKITEQNATIQPPQTAPKFGHTPGPWHLADYNGEENRYVVGPSGELVADCYAESAADLNMPEDYRDNARLIAAAPELLAALRSVIDYAEAEAYSLEAHKDSEECDAEAKRAHAAVELAREIIAKAQGNS